MIAMTLAEAASAMGGVLHGADAGFRGVGTDTRRSLGGVLFFALRGERHDGHDHVSAARAAGAVAVVVSHDDESSGLPRIVVDDTLRALGRLGGAWRARCPAKVIAITGNSGKTTTKELAAAVLRRAGETLATEGNLNNEIGVPLTLMKLDAAHRFAVIEMGQAKPGDISYLAAFTRPDIALVTNVTGAHLAGFGSLEAIAAGKGEVYGTLSPEGVAIINLDDAFAAHWRAQLPRCRVMTFGLAAEADVRAEDVRLGSDGCARFTLVTGSARAAVTLAIPGLHNVANALAAASAGLACGVAPGDIAGALGTTAPVSGRLVVRQLADGTRLIDDTYNANPGSVQAAIRTLKAYPGRHLLVLGHMAELGPMAPQLHHGIGEFARVHGVDALYVTGDFAAETVAGFDAGATAFADIDALVSALRPALGKNVTVLVKGSRSARMERVVAALTGEEDAALAH